MQGEGRVGGELGPEPGQASASGPSPGTIWHNPRVFGFLARRRVVCAPCYEEAEEEATCAAKHWPCEFVRHQCRLDVCVLICVNREVWLYHFRDMGA